MLQFNISKLHHPREKCSLGIHQFWPYCQKRHAMLPSGTEHTNYNFKLPIFVELTALENKEEGSSSLTSHYTETDWVNVDTKLLYYTKLHKGQMKVIYFEKTNPVPSAWFSSFTKCVPGYTVRVHLPIINRKECHPLLIRLGKYLHNHHTQLVQVHTEFLKNRNIKSQLNGTMTNKC